MNFGQVPRRGPAVAVRAAMSKVPEITVFFWIIKILTTGMGETASDFLVHKYSPYLAVFIGAIVFAVAMALQFNATRYVTWVYWFAVAMVSVFGTMAADSVHIGLGVPYQDSVVGFSVALVVVFAAWYRSERTLSIHSIYTRRRETFYWATVLITFALGTAAGDWTARTLHLGFFKGGVLFAVAFAIPAIGYWLFRVNSILAFWAAYVLTRPLGASFADWMGIGHRYGGLGYGYGTVSVALSVLIVGFVGYLAVTGADTPERGQSPTRNGGRHRREQGEPDLTEPGEAYAP